MARGAAAAAVMSVYVVVRMMIVASHAFGIAAAMLPAFMFVFVMMVVAHVFFYLP